MSPTQRHSADKLLEVETNETEINQIVPDATQSAPATNHLFLRNCRCLRRDTRKREAASLLLPLIGTQTSIADKSLSHPSWATFEDVKTATGVRMDPRVKRTPTTKVLSSATVAQRLETSPVSIVNTRLKNTVPSRKKYPPHRFAPTKAPAW